MELNELRISKSAASKRLIKKHAYFNKVIDVLREKELPDSISAEINKEIDSLNRIHDSDFKKTNKIRKAINRIIKQVQKELNWVPRNYHRNLWMALGMSAFGIPMGVAFGMSLNNMAYLGIGMPIGMAMGIAIGTNMDKKAESEGRQLNIDYEL